MTIMRKKRDIIIELTSLLDVIMIMIFLVMTENSKLITEKQSSLDSMIVDNEKLKNDRDKLGEQLDETLASLDEALAKLDEGSYEELLERLQIAESKLESYEFMNHVVTVINVELENKYNHTVRYLTFGDAASESDSRAFEIHSDSDFENAVNRLKVYVADHISGVSNKPDSPIVYLVFTYDQSNVFHDDYAAVHNALSDAEIRSSSGNVRYRQNRITSN